MIAVDTNILVYSLCTPRRHHNAGACVAAVLGVETLLTRDRDFSVFRELRVRDPFA